MRDFLNSPAAGALLVAVAGELRAWFRGRQAHRERQAFREELAALTPPTHNDTNEE